jgi:DNA-binding NarL/FixJ family response regulator
MDSIDPFAPTLPMPTANRPLLGLTVLVIEDSRFACEAMRLLCLRSGARIRRADSVRSAHRHLKVYRPTIAIVDIGLPDGNGLDLISELTSACPRPEVVIGTSGDNFEDEVMAAGADRFLAKPLTSLSVFQECILSCLPQDCRPNGLRALTDETVEPDPLAYQDDIAHVADVLEDNKDDRVLDYVAQFTTGVARSAHDDTLADAAQELADKRAAGQASASETAKLAGLIQQRLTDSIAI